MKTKLHWLLPLLFVAAISPFTPYLDLTISSLFYTPIVGAKGHFVENGVTYFLYTYGELFGVASGGVALGIYLFSFGSRRLKKWRKGALALVLTLVVGAGLITNVGFKEHWGRPRPKQIENFGGKLAYRPFWQPTFKKPREPQKSFPSGHTAMGFYYFSLCLVGRRYKSRALFNLGLFLTLALGGGLFVCRIIQGGHFFSDTLVAALIMWLVSLIVDRLVFTSAKEEKKELAALETPQP